MLEARELDGIRPRVDRWLAETHGSRFELLRHFLARFFEGEMVGSSGDWTRLAAGAFAVLPSSWVLMFLVWNLKYGDLLHRLSPHPYQLAVRSDLSWLLAVAMCLTAALTAIEWNALFPSRRDLLSLASLPLRPGEVFVAKFAALLTMFGIFVALLTVPAAFAFVCIVSGRYLENPSILWMTFSIVAAASAACAFVFFCAVGLQGLLLNLLPARWFARVSVFVQAALFTVSLGTVPFLVRPPSSVWWPPQWFLGLWAALAGVQGAAARTAIVSVAATLALALVSYLLSYRRYERVLLEGIPHTARGLLVRAGGKIGALLLDFWIRNPREQAMFVFIGKTFARSRNHRLVLLAYLGLALGWLGKSLVGLLQGGPVRVQSPAMAHAHSDALSMLVIVASAVIATVVAVALRYLFSLPVELGANWIYQITEQDGRAAWLRAVERFVVWCGIAPVYILAYPIAAAVMGSLPALAATVLGFGELVVLFEVLFLSWQKAPFTCSYLPGKRPVVFQTVPAAIFLTVLAPATALVWFGTRAPVFPMVLAIEIAAIACLRVYRHQMWAERPLVYIDELDPAVTTLDIGVRVGEILAEPAKS